MSTPTPSRRCSASPACRRLAKAGNARRCARCSQDEARATTAATLLLAQEWAADLHVRAIQARARAGLGAPDAVAVRAGRDHAEFLDRPQLARRAGRRRDRDPARSWPGLRHRHPSDDAHVPALDREAMRSLGRACSTTAAARASSPSAPPCMAHAGRRSRHRRCRHRCDRRQRPAQRRHADGRNTGRRSRALPAGAGQHPGHAPEPCWRHCSARMWRRAATWCWPAFSSARSTSCERPTRPGWPLRSAIATRAGS